MPGGGSAEPPGEQAVREVAPAPHSRTACSENCGASPNLQALAFPGASDRLVKTDTEMIAGSGGRVCKRHSAERLLQLLRRKRKAAPSSQSALS